MTDLEQLAASLPIDQLAAQFGADPQSVQSAISVALPALLNGLQANAQDPGGAESLASALTQHDNDLVSGQVDLGQVNVADGEKIVGHIFGANTDAVVQQLGSTGGGSSLISKLLPILAPIVLSYLAKQMGGASGGSGALGGILEQILTGAAQGSGSASSSGGALGGVLDDLLGGLLGGGRKS